MFSGPLHESSREIQVQVGTIVRAANARELMLAVSYEPDEDAHTGSQRSSGH